MPEDKSNKTEPATPRRRLEERNKGHLAKSQDLGTAAILLAAMLILYFFGGTLLNQLQEVNYLLLSSLDTPTLTAEDLQAHMATGAYKIGLGMAPLIVGLAVVALLVNLAQVGFLFTGEPMMFNPGKLNPVTGIGRMFSKRAAAKLVASMLKLIAISIVLYYTSLELSSQIVPMMQSDTGQIFMTILSASFTVGIRMALLLLILALLDYAFQKWQHEQDIKMSKQEVKDEMKMHDGDPKTKERRMRVQREIAKQRMMHKVPEADVVITNPTHLACAIQYDPDAMIAPVLVAKGAGLIARRIREIAAEHGIPLIEKKPLAQAIYKSVEIGQEVPPDLYQAVAEILAYVYQLEGKSAV